MKIIKINPADNVAVAIEPLQAGEIIDIDGQRITLNNDVPAGHKILLSDLVEGENVIKYGYPIGHLKQSHKKGDWICHDHIKTNLAGLLDYEYKPVSKADLTNPAYTEWFPQEQLTFQGYRRKNGEVGIRNEVWIVPTVGCVNGIVNQLAEKLKQEVNAQPSTVNPLRIVAYPHNYGCSQLSDDHENTRKVLRDLVLHPNAGAVLVVGLGNREVTPDALGPKVIDNMFITRHIMKEFGRYAFSDENVSRISGIVPGVMAQTGMECVEILKGIVKETQPELIITVDALAARNVKRLGRTIQLTDTGITPGSGIGNHRNALNEQSLGLPVISLGVPTVVNAATIVADAMSELIEAEASSCQDLENLDEQQRQELAHGLLSPKLNELFVTPKNIDESIKQLSFLLSEGLNIALLGNKEENAGI